MTRAQDATEATMSRLRKLLAQAEGEAALGNQAAAEAFAAKAAELAMKAKIELADIQTESLQLEPEEEVDQELLGQTILGTLNKRRATTWVIVVAKAIAKANSCEEIITNGGQMILVGTPSDRTVARYLIQVLVRVGRELGDKHYAETYREAVKAGDVTQARGCRKSFLTGFARGLETKLIEQMRRTRSEVPHAVVVLDQAAERSKDWMKRNMRTKNVGLNNAAPRQASFELGQDAGKNVGLTPGVAPGKKSTVGMIAGLEQRRLGAGA